MPDKKSNKTEITIAVLSFRRLSEKDDLDYLISGFVDDLTFHLSRFKSLLVISPRSTHKIDAETETGQKQIKSLNTDYFVQGSFRNLADNLRIQVQLVNASDGSIVWANKYDSKLSSLFDVHDDIIEHLVVALQEKIDTDILQLSKSKKMTNLEAYECWLHGMQQLEQGTLESDMEARKYFEQALKIEPDYARAFTGLSLSYFNEWSCQLWDRWDESQQGAFKYARKAVSIDADDSVSLTVLGRILLYKGDFEKGEYYLRKSLNLNPNDATNLSHLAVSFIYLGYIEEAENLYLKALKLNPLNEVSYYAAGTLLSLELGEFEKAIELGVKTNFDQVWVDLPAMIAAAYYHTGDLTNMKKYWGIFQENFKERILHGKEAEQHEALRWIIDVNPYKADSRYVPFLEYLKNEGQYEHTTDTNISLIFSDENLFKRGAGLWEMNFEGKSVFLPDVKGYNDISKLMENVNSEIHCTELMGNPVIINDEEFMLDDKAKDTYKKKINDLSLEIDEAELMHDESRAAELRQEYEELIEHLSKSLGLGGKSRKLNSSVEKSRSAVTWRIRSAIKKIGEAHPSLSKHLSNSVKTGIFCSYSPERETEWGF